MSIGNPPQVISLDLDDTLWPVAPVLAAAEAALLSWMHGRHPRAMRGHDADSMRELRARIAARFPQQSHDMTFLRRRALAEQFAAAGYFLPPGLDALAAAASHAEAPRDSRGTGAAEGGAGLDMPLDDGMSPLDDAMEVFLAARNRVQLYDDVRPALLRLRAKYRLFAVSNGNADLARCGLGDLFDGHVTAAAAGAAKPDARIFARLIRDAGVAAAHILHVGDDPLTDVMGALRAGLQAAWLNREGRRWPSEFAPPPRTIATLAELD